MDQEVITLSDSDSEDLRPIYERRLDQNVVLLRNNGNLRNPAPRVMEDVDVVLSTPRKYAPVPRISPLRVFEPNLRISPVFEPNSRISPVFEPIEPIEAPRTPPACEPIASTSGIFPVFEPEEVPSRIPPVFPPVEPAVRIAIAPTRAPAEPQDDLEAEEVPRKRKKRTREQIEEEKLAKEVARIEREANTAKNSKCEQYLHCFLNADILRLEGSLEAKLLSLFQERNIVEQLHVEDTLAPMHISWKRKTVEAKVEGGKVARKERMIQENVFAYVIDAHSLSDLISSKTLSSHLESVLYNYAVADARLTVIVYGNVTTKNDKLTDCFLEAFEKNRIQLRQIHNVDDFVYLIAQMHRALAKHDRSKDDESRSIFSAEKGMKRDEADNLDEFVRDWWGKMLLYMHRLSEDQRRAILKTHPNPFKLMDQLIAAPTPTAAMKDLADIVTENGRRLGPVLAQKIYHMLTTEDGLQLLTD